MSTQFNCQKHFHFKLFKQLYVTIQLSVNTVLMSKNNSIWNNSVKHKFKCKYGLIVKNVSTSFSSFYIYIYLGLERQAYQQLKCMA